jgi:hydroxymethylpyrimidine/phosphomethylpyrimidine kinase
LTVAGSDPSGGAGVQADLKTFHQHGVYGTTVLTLLTVQNTRGVSRVMHLEPEWVMAELDAVLEDIPPAAAKIGALGSAAVVRAVAERAAGFDFPLVVDPVMVSKHGSALIEASAAAILRERLLPHALLVTPNLSEAAVLSDCAVTDTASMERAARVIAARGPGNVLIKGGHLDGRAIDLFWSEGKVQLLESERVETRHTHGTGCVLSAAITARLALGDTLDEALRGAKAFVTRAIRGSPGLGSGAGPVDLFAPVGDSGTDAT